VDHYKRYVDRVENHWCISGSTSICNAWFICHLPVDQRFETRILAAFMDVDPESRADALTD